ncbi:HAD family phosphatase [Actinacidiphila glaucinigra]|uniref:HAD family hydrolase n=1 Tax=Actinacidiphila glaucinigra TaxID=235986 RepID=UPI002DD8D7C1|nr:HAD family phosphatase [Actinacidiphila glaucinigra]WSD58329.1 HAD family phosphatase [Actinacidiphila glaucinigra]
MRSTVLFDLFGVIACRQSAEGRERLERLVLAPGVPATRFWDAYWGLRPPYDRGELTGSAYWGGVAAALGTRFDSRRAETLIAADVDSWSAVDPPMVALVEELASQGCRIGLLSNIPEELAAHYEARHAWLRHFQVRALSCRTGQAKPDPAAYHWCRDALREDPARILFVDDRPENIHAARAAGMRGHLFTTPARFRRHLLRAALLRPSSGDAAEARDPHGT